TPGVLLKGCWVASYLPSPACSSVLSPGCLRLPLGPGLQFGVARNHADKTRLQQLDAPTRLLDTRLLQSTQRPGAVESGGGRFDLGVVLVERRLGHRECELDERNHGKRISGIVQAPDRADPFVLRQEIQADSGDLVALLEQAADLLTGRGEVIDAAPNGG